MFLCVQTVWLSIAYHVPNVNMENADEESVYTSSSITISKSLAVLTTEAICCAHLLSAYNSASAELRAIVDCVLE